MKVLLAGKFVPSGPRPIGGLQSWIKTVRAELERRGHECAEWQPGMALRGTFDVGIVANLSVTRPVLNFCRRSICVSHGIIAAEKPEAGCDDYLFVSEGTREHWGWDGDILRQPIDLDFWSPGGERYFLTRYSYRRAPIHGKAVADALELEWCHLYDVTHEEAREQLRRSVVAFATGRAALEAMACGVPTVIYDHRQAYQGPLLCEDLARAMKHNYSGRGGYEPNLADVIHHARREMFLGSPRAWVEEHHDARKIVDDLCSRF